MKKYKYYVGCYGFGDTVSGFKTMRVVTNIKNYIPLFEKDDVPLEFTSKDADVYTNKLLDDGWAAVTIRVPHDRKNICWN
jgi:hypothetical protein